jgi:hypothetical protein
MRKDNFRVMACWYEYIPVMRVVVKVFWPAWSFIKTNPNPPDMELKCWSYPTACVTNAPLMEGHWLR